MPVANFYLKEPGASGDTLIYLVYHLGGQKLKYSTGQKIAPRFWNPEKQRVKETRQFPGHVELNTLLNNVESAAHNAFRRLVNDKISPSPGAIREILDQAVKIAPQPAKQALITFAFDLVENSNRKPNTKKQLRQAIRNLQEYERKLKKTLTFDMIDLAFYDGYLQFLTQKGYGVNSIGTIVKNLKVVMNEAIDRGLTGNMQFKNRRFKTMEEPSESIYLTVGEIKTLYGLNLKSNPKLDRVRDLFVIGCYTGLRFSDLSQLREENFIDQGTKVRVKTEKTGELVVIPLHTYIKAILKKYGGVPPAVLSNQKMNDYLKEVGDWAGFHEEVLLTITKGGERVKESFKKYELITTHTARRSFATNAYLQGVPTLSIMKITGHRTEKSFLKYIKISQEDNANKLIHHPFFNS